MIDDKQKKNLIFGENNGQATHGARKPFHFTAICMSEFHRPLTARGLQIFEAGLELIFIIKYSLIKCYLRSPKKNSQCTICKCGTKEILFML